MIGMAAMVGTGGAFFSNEAFQARQGLIKAFTSIEGSVEAARSKFDEIVNEANEYGLSAQSLAESYKQIRNALEGTGIENASLKVTKALEIFGTATGMTSQETIRAIDAISDTAAQGSLDNINAEQLARSTGVNIVSMAKALDMSAQEFQKALSEGKITPDKFIEPFADLLLARANQGGALDRAKSSTQAQQNRAANQFLESNAVLNASGLNEYFNKVYQALREMLQTAEPLIEELGEFFSGAAESSSKNIKSFGNLLAAIGNVSDSLDGIDIESPFISLNELLTGLTNFINDVADTIDFLRSDDTWQEKLSGINDLLINTLKRITETFINMAIENVNRILPSFMEMDNVNFETRSLKRLNSDVIDMSGVNALMSEIARKVPRTPDVHDPAALPFGPVMNRQGEAFNTTNNNNQTFNFEIHGEDGNIQDQVIQVINDYVIRPASISEVQSEK
ncbi:hypothetical protein C9J49_014330 [Halomonas sp. SL1]|nr:hypothetical protein C9J49_014330 [Halomonas sp. SL1]